MKSSPLGVNCVKAAGGLLKCDDLKIINYSTAMSCLPLHIAVNFYSAERFLISSLQFYRGVIEDRMLLGSIFILYSFKNMFSSPTFLSLFMKMICSFIDVKLDNALVPVFSKKRYFPFRGN